MTEENTVVEAEETGGKEPARDYEAEARAQGWVPEAEFKGDRRPAQFLDAETFVKRGEELTPFIRKENQSLKRQLDETKADFAKRVERLERSATQGIEALKRQHQSELDSVRSQMRAAVEAGDTKEFDRLEKVRDGLVEKAPKIEEPEKVDPEKDFEARRTAWVNENSSWFDEDKDPDLYDWVVGRSQRIGAANPNKSFEQVMALTAAEAKKAFPDKFGGKKTGNGQSAVDAGSDFSGVFGGKGKKTEADLPAEAKAAGQRFVRDGVFKDMKAYAKAYYEENPNG